MASPRNSAVSAVALLALLMWLYVREFAVLSNTLEVKWVVIGSMLVVGSILGVVLWYWRDRFIALERHFPEVVMLVVFTVLFAPLFGSLLNRSLGEDETQSFEFISETAYFASGYGFLKGEKLSPTGWRLTVREGRVERRIKYKSQAYFPLTKPGETVSLPVRRGIFGARVVNLW